MKTIRTSASMILILAGIFSVMSVFSKNGPDRTLPGGSPKFVTYIVNVLIPLENPPEGEYIILLVDGKGKPVVPAQAYKPGVSAYTFRESADVRGSRTAMMVEPNGKTAGFRPFSLAGPFVNGLTYFFTLVPIDKGDKPIER